MNPENRNAVRQEVPLNPETGKPVLNTVAALAVAPSASGSELSQYVAQVIQVIEQSGLDYETNAMFTNIEGDLDDVLAVVRDASHVLAEQGYRTSVSLKLDIRPGFEQQMQEKPQLIAQILHQNWVQHGQ